MSTEKSDAVLVVDGVAVPVRVRRSARARAYRLSLDQARGELRLSLPMRANLMRALGWAQEHEGWVRSQMARQPAQLMLDDGVVFPLEGREVRICWVEGASRTIRLDGDRLLLGGAAESVGPRVVRWLKMRARTVLETESHEMARDNGLIVASVGIGDPRSRWASCASSGAIRYSWRLILCPPGVRRATVAHELAHLLHMDHSPAFHAAHKRILEEDPRPARAWLRAHGTALHRIAG
ncbi:M48 family metallopeptidase [Sphingobium estronivorans]|uniref:M48 family metallopeptidase n=1 Tax=Sphingobium estronivorans TaxID=1577690 RepID=UPI001238BC84|nr:YgjP-like metallopeptidase domain-containing protein [Sphingobium estronivorans]